MSYYTPITGTIVSIDTLSSGTMSNAGCTLLINMETEDQGAVNMVLPSNVYVLNARPFQVGDRATFFYDPQAPAPLIYPPQYRAVTAAYTPSGTNAMLDVFNSDLTNTDNTLTLNMTDTTPVTVPNGQNFYENIADKLLMVIYGATTRSIPAQTTPEQVVVFCSES